MPPRRDSLASVSNVSHEEALCGISHSRCSVATGRGTERDRRRWAEIASVAGPSITQPQSIGPLCGLLTNWEIYVEDLFVRTEHRGKGAGKSLLRKIGEIALAGGHRRVDLNVLNWNQASINVYERLGALHLSEWTRMRFGGYAIKKLARQE
jgi:GNAT superfamily N-acetyltransferase